MRFGSAHTASTLVLGLATAVALAGCGASARSAGTASYTPYERMPEPSVAPYASGAVAKENTESYADYGVNPAVDTKQDRFSTFAVDVDTASYSISRRKLREGSLPPKEAVRVEEFVNSFSYGYEAPKQGPFAVHLAAAPSPFAQGHHLVRVALQGKQVSDAERTPVHLVYLVDTSGSMMSDDKIGLAKKSLHLLTESLKKGDTVALCTYAGWVREVLPPTGVDKKSDIHAAIDQLAANGSTAMSSGIDLAYSLAKKTLVKGHVNRVVVLSDGDANVGPSSHEEILKQIEQYKNDGITLSTVGFGQGNYKDVMMEQLADKGDGNYSYIDDEAQARKVFGKQVNGLLQVIARDVKVQVEFDPEVVKEYRLIGYENRDVADKDFRNDKVDGGEIGAGHSVTAIYDVVFKKTDASPLVVRVRNKAPLGGDVAQETSWKLEPSAIAKSFADSPASFRFAAAVAGFAEKLRKSPYTEASWTELGNIAKGATIDQGESSELVELVGRAEKLAGK
jgi:Ca-activated chloride channel family protein